MIFLLLSSQIAVPNEVCPVTLPELTRQSISLGQTSIVLDVPSSSDSVLEHSLSGQSQNPYWGVLWDAAIPMARYVIGKHWPVTKSGLELGCGVGLIGIAAWHAGLSVRMTDIVPEAIELTRHNAGLNGLPNSEVGVLDWNQPPPETYSLILACDVLYERNQHAGLLKFLQAASQHDTEIHIGDPGRQSSRLFWDDAVAAGFDVEVYQEQGQKIEELALQQFCVFVLRAGTCQPA